MNKVGRQNYHEFIGFFLTILYESRKHKKF